MKYIVSFRTYEYSIAFFCSVLAGLYAKICLRYDFYHKIGSPPTHSQISQDSNIQRGKLYHTSCVLWLCVHCYALFSIFYCICLCIGYNLSICHMGNLSVYNHSSIPPINSLTQELDIVFSCFSCFNFLCLYLLYYKKDGHFAI